MGKWSVNTGTGLYLNLVIFGKHPCYQTQFLQVRLQQFGPFSLSILAQPLQTLKQGIPEGFPVTWAQLVEERVNSLMILGVQILIYMIEAIANHLLGRISWV